MPPDSSSRRPGFSMIGLLVVLAVVGFLLALLLPAVQRVREAAARSTTQGRLKQIVLGTINCADTYRGRMPPAFGKYVDKNAPAASLHVHILPYVEQFDLYKSIIGGAKGSDNEVVPAFVSPADPSRPEPARGVQNFPANLRAFSNKGRNTRGDAPLPALGREEPGTTRFPASFTDGCSNTVLFATRYAVCGDGGSRYAAAPNTNTAAFFGQNPAKVAARPADPTATFLLHPAAGQCQPTPLMAHSFFTSGMDVALADGSIHAVTARVSPATWNAALTPSEGDELGNDW